MMVLLAITIDQVVVQLRLAAFERRHCESPSFTTYGSAISGCEHLRDRVLVVNVRDQELSRPAANQLGLAESGQAAFG